MWRYLFCISGFGLVKDTLDPMLGKAPENEQVEEIRQKILSYPGVLGTHELNGTRLRTRQTVCKCAC